MSSQDSKKIVSEISLLYELALAAGRSLNLRDNCEQFLRALMARKNLAYAAVWTRREALPDAWPVEKGATAQDWVLVYASPEHRIADRHLPSDHPIAARLAKTDAFSVASREKGFAPILTEKQITNGTFAVFALGTFGFLKLFSMTREEAFTEQELNQLRNVVAKFTVSIEGCLAHEKLVGEMKQRARTEEALRQSEAKYRNVVERASDGIIIIQEGLIAYVNGRLAAMIGAPAEDVVGTPFTRFLHPSVARAVVENYQRRIAGESIPAVYETVLIDANGRPVHTELNAGVITYQGQPADLVFVRDTTERRKAEIEHSRLAMVVEQTADAVMIADTHGIIQYVNPAFERITGYGRQEAVGQNPRILKSGRQDASVYRTLWETIAGGQGWRGRIQNRRKDGTLFTCDAIITPTHDENGAIINYVSVQRDVTRELQMEEQYLQAQKMESIGRLAGGIAHDFNNIMTAVLGFGSMILDQLGDSHPMRHAVEQIVSAGERATNLTRQLLTFSRKQIVEVRVLDINAVVAEMYQLLRRALGEDVDLVTLLNDDAGCVKADSGLLQQVVMNLAINARDAMPRGGQLTIHTSHVVLDDRFCKERVGVQQGEYVLLSVRDTGAGMPADVLQHAFEPFFTTKAKGKGTGLGLATVYGIVRQCGGHIELESEVGRGTEVKMWIPRVETPAETLPVEIEDRLQKGSETLLVVEDEDMVRDLTVRILKSLGYRILEACNGKEALALVERHKEPIQLVLTDVVMPQMGGPEMIEHLLEIRPRIKVLYTSGFTETAVTERGVAVGKARLIQKPYTREILAQRIRQTLDEG
jgi:two-component system, cell cycle sensor histidine kinase and response regulator CckA